MPTNETDPDPKYEAALVPAAGRSRRRRAERRPAYLGKVLGVVATALSLVLGFVAIIPILTENSSGLNKIVSFAEPYRTGSLSTFALSLDTAVSTFPEAGSGGSCSEEQRSWLEVNGREFISQYLVTLQNTATSGNVISISRFAGAANGIEDLASASNYYLVECEREGNAAPKIAPGRLMLSSSSPASYDRSRISDNLNTPDSPVIYNLAPGETGQFVLELVSAYDFDGEVELVVASGSDRVTTTLDMGGAVHIPGAAARGVRAVAADDSFWECARSQGPKFCEENL